MSLLKKLFPLGLLFVTLISCQKSDSGTSAVDKDGNCKQETINAYNNISSTAYFKSPTELQSSCQNYKNLIGSQTCTAVVVSTGATKSINSTSLDGVCDKKLSSPTETTTLPSTPASPSRRESELSDYCSDEVISSFNQFLNSAKIFQMSKSEQDLKDFVLKCQSFKQAIHGQSCNAQNAMKEKIVISYDKFKALCEMGDSIKPTPDTTNEVASLKNGVKIVILKATKMNLLLQKGKIIKNGKILNQKSTNQIGACRIEKKTPQVFFQNKQVLVLTAIENIQNATVIDDSRSPFSIVCLRENFSKGTTLRDLDNIFSGILDFTVNE